MNLQNSVNLKRLFLTFVGVISLILSLASCSNSSEPTPSIEIIVPTAITAPETPSTAAAVSSNESTVAATAVPPPTNLLYQFPPMPKALENPLTPQKVELGRQLFFDPVLSVNNEMSCATCHQPEMGFSDGRPVSEARADIPGRNVSTLWNSGYNQYLLWDGRETSLESQAQLPLTLDSEMANDPAELVARLQAIPAYVDLFETAFGSGQPLTFEQITAALSAFQRTLVSENSAYDRYAAGDATALTEQQKRGLALFFSDTTHCSQCHAPPTFASETFRVIGVDSDDPGRAGVRPEGVYGAFNVPTLRNITQTAPYMHDGSFATLPQVVEFYAAGGGRVHDFEYVDPLIKGFTLSTQEKADLVAFLDALTDVSGLPEVPETAVSGLPVQYK